MESNIGPVKSDPRLFFKLRWNKKQISILENDLQTGVTIRLLTDLKRKKKTLVITHQFFFCSASFSLFIFKAMENIKKLGLLHCVIVCSTPIWKCNNKISFVFNLFSLVLSTRSYPLYISKINKKEAAVHSSFLAGGPSSVQLYFT